MNTGIAPRSVLVRVRPAAQCLRAPVNFNIGFTSRSVVWHQDDSASPCKYFPCFALQHRIMRALMTASSWRYRQLTADMLLYSAFSRATS